MTGSSTELGSPESGPREDCLELLDCLEAAWFGVVTPSSSYRTQDSASSLHEHRRSKSGKLRLVQPLQTEADRQGSLHSSSQAPGKASSQAPRLVRRRSLRKRTSSSPTVEACGAQQTPASGELAGLSAPALSPRQPQGGGSPEADFDPSSLPGLGTWAQRQFHFQQQGCSPPEQVGTPMLPVPHAASRGVQPAAGAEDDAVAAAAWRWRFNRRWANEQAKLWDPEQSRRSLDGDAWDDALEVLGACGPAGRANLAHTVSTENELATPRHISPRSSDLSTCMLNESRTEGATLAEADTDSTRKTAALARKAHSLFRQQLEIEQRVNEQWNNAAAQGANWIGLHLQTVITDSHGRSDFILVRVSERRGYSKMVVRSQQGSTPAGLQQALHRQAEQCRRAEGLPSVTLTLLGLGCMEWQGQGEDSVTLRCTESVKGVKGALESRQDVARVTASLMRSALPLHQTLHVQIL